MATRFFLSVTQGRLGYWLLKNVILRPVWLWHCLRARSLWFFTPSNPTITFGGFAGGSKTQIFKQLPLGTYQAPALVTPDKSVEYAVNLLAANGFGFPVMARPDMGTSSYMNRRIDSEEQLRQYHRAMPVPYILQEATDHLVEVSVFYHRLPGSESGHITHFFQRDGVRSTGLFTEKDNALLRVFDNISNHSGSFFYGRFDIRCRSVQELKEGRGFCIVNFTGAGADLHVPGSTWFQTAKTLLRHWSLLFAISKANHHQGIPYWHHPSGRDFVAYTKSMERELRQLDVHFEFVDEVETIMIPASLVPFTQKYAKVLSPGGDII